MYIKIFVFLAFQILFHPLKALLNSNIMLVSKSSGNTHTNLHRMISTCITLCLHTSYCKVLIDWVLYNPFFIISISPIKFFKTFF